MSESTEPRKLYYRQNFAFSTNYLDYEIPDFCEIINAAIPALIYEDTLLSMIDGALRPLDGQAFSRWITDILRQNAKLLCNDAVGFHHAALMMAGDKEPLKEKVWQLTDTYSLWDASLFDQRLIWAVEGRTIDRPDFEQLLEQYQIPQTVSPLDGLREIFLSQFTRLVEGLPFLKNDVAGRRVFREHEYDLPYIPAPCRVLARNGIHFKERLHVFMPLIEGWRKYGPACIGLDVRGAIAVHYQNENRYHVASGAAAEYERKKSQLQSRLIGRCSGGNYISFGQNGGETVPVYNEENARRRLREHWQDSTDFQPRHTPVRMDAGEIMTEEGWENECPPDRHESPSSSDSQNELLATVEMLWKPQERQGNRFSRQPRCFPVQEDGEISLNLAHWGETLPPNGPIRHWSDYQAASQVFQSTDVRYAQIHHESFPYLKSPAAEYADRTNLPLLVPSPGQRFLMLRIRDLDLLCYLRTHGEYEFIHETGRNELEALDHLSGGIDASNHTTTTEWSSTDMLESFPSFTDGEYKTLHYRNLPCDSRISRICWEAEPFYSAYGFFTRPHADRDRFLAAIFGYDRDDHDNNVSLAWYLPENRREELFYAIARKSIKGFIHGWSAQVIADQLHGEHGNAIPRNIQDHTFVQEIERLHGMLLNNFRFHGQIASFLYATLLPKLCIDPVVRSSSTTSGLPEELFVDGQWREDDALGTRIPIDPMVRDAKGDNTDRNIINGTTANPQALHRWEVFLAPLLGERCRELVIDRVEPGSLLFQRLYTTNAISRNGKPGRPVYEVEKPYTCWMETLDDLKKTVAYALVRAGMTLVAVSSDSFVVEVSEDTSLESIRAVTDITHRICEEILGLRSGICENFVENSIIRTWPQ